MADVIRIDNRSVTIFDEQDILEIVLKECGSDVYAWLQDCIDELKLEIKDLEEYINDEIAEYEQNIKEHQKEIQELNLEIGRLYRELRMSDVRLP